MTRNHGFGAKQGKSKTQEGDALVETIIAHTGLPKELITRELISVLKRHGVDSRNVTLAQLRQAMAEYLANVQSDILRDDCRKYPIQ